MLGSSSCLFYFVLIYITACHLSHALGKPYLIVANDNENKKVNEFYRTKRDVIVSAQEETKETKDSHIPFVAHTELKSEHSQLLIDWVGEGSNVVVLLTRERDHEPQVQSSVFISFDYGNTFQNRSHLFVMENNKSAIIANFYKNEKFPSRFLFMDTVHKYMFVTVDYGRTVWARKLDFTPSDVITHPTDAMVIVAHDKEDPLKRLMISSDFGETWRVLGYYVQSYRWSPDEGNPKLFVQRDEPGGHSAVVAYTKLSKGFEVPEPVISDIDEFEVKEEFLFAVKKVHLLGSKSREPSLQLWISYKGGPFLKARFPHSTPHQQYYVPFVSQGQVLVCVAHDSTTSHLYVSSVPQSEKHEVLFSLSLPRIFYYHPNTTWHNTWLKEVENKAFADLHAVAGVRGVLIASQVSDNYTDTENTNYNHPRPMVGPQHLTTVISFDLGGQWQPVTPPQYDANGNKIECDRSAGCSLHLSQQFASRYPNTQSETILSAASAPGIILATGTIGTSLNGKASVFLSRDAGITWHEVLKGTYLYVLADHGGLMVAVGNYRSEGESNALLYSVDEGETWLTHQFYSKQLRAYGLKTEPGENSTVVLLFGSNKAEHEWVVFKIDLKPVFERKCDKNDYKTWMPSDPNTSMPRCLLGRSEKFERRIPRVNCYNGFNYDRPFSIHNCPCARQDYECDFGYVMSDVPETHSHLARTETDQLMKGNGSKKEHSNAEWIDPHFKEQKCVKDTGDAIIITGSDASKSARSVLPVADQPMCKEGRFYNKTRGYRKIPGDTCQGGLSYLYEPELTPCPLFEEQEFLLVSSRSSVLRYDLLRPEVGLQPLPLTGISMLIAFDFDLLHNCFYWTDIVANTIMRECFDGQRGRELLLDHGLERVEGLAFDWISQNLYLVDAARRAISVLKINQQPHPLNFRPVIMKTIFDNKTLDKPRGIALHPVEGIMFFTDWSHPNPMIARSNLDGSDFKILYGKGVVGWPNGITVDYQSEKIFFVDALNNFIASSDFNGQKFTKLVETGVERPFGIAVHKGLIYWDDTATKLILWSDKEEGGPGTPVTNNTIKGLVDLKTYGHWSQKGSNACEGDKNRCSHICTGHPSAGYSCLCPDNLKMSAADNTTCVCNDDTAPNANGVCGSNTTSGSSNTSHCVSPTGASNEMACANGRCVPRSWHCDGADDCGDNSDEIGCSSSTTRCPESSFQCDDGRCILSLWRCDFDVDCKDGSDERNCHYPTCDPGMFRCKNGHCINKRWLCDLEDDCKDNSDEEKEFCANITSISLCKHNQFSCRTGNNCIPLAWKCDNDKDCTDGSDEDSCAEATCDPERRFQCDNKQCIVNLWRCDGENDCIDNSDEKDCTSIVVSPNKTTTAAPPAIHPYGSNCSLPVMFNCTVGYCVPVWWTCDGLEDCTDGSDEAGCPVIDTSHIMTTTTTAKPVPLIPACNVDQFECSAPVNASQSSAKKQPACIWSSWVCDGDEDCPTGEDERHCNSTELHPCTLKGYRRCLHSVGCYTEAARCDGRRHCADDTDEEGCNVSPSSAASTSCPSDQHSCDGDCFPASILCDHKLDCLDLSDELNCTYENSHRLTLTAQSVLNVSASITWRVQEANASDTLQFLPAFIRQAAVGNAAAWKYATNWTKAMSYTFRGLTPATTYLIRVFVRTGSEKPAEHSLNVISITTEHGVPSPVQFVSVIQVDDMVRVSWQPPISPNGQIKNYTVFVRPPNPPQQVTVHGNLTDITVSLAAPLHNTNYTIWVTASTPLYTSAPSNEATLLFIYLNCPKKLHVEQVTESSAQLSWDAVPLATSYVVIHTRPENDFLHDRVSMKTSSTTAVLSDLSPGMKYVAEVKSMSCSAPSNKNTSCIGESTVKGPPCAVSFTTTGIALTAVTHLSAQVAKHCPTTVILSWQPPQYKKQVSWQYEIIWGISGMDFRRDPSNPINNNSVSTSDTSYTITNLMPCQKYLLAVMVSGPLGYGPAVQVQVMTLENPESPPTLISTVVTNLTMEIVWEPSCPLSTMLQSHASSSTEREVKAPVTSATSRDVSSDGSADLRFLLNITETTRNETSYFQLPGEWYKDHLYRNKKYLLTHKIKVTHGGHYQVTISSITGNIVSKPSSPPFISNGPSIPAPRQLTFTETDTSLFWRKAPNMPPALLTDRYSYVVYLRTGVPCSTVDDPEVPWEYHDAPQPPYVCPHLNPGQVYCVAVAFKTSKGYLSERSTPIRVEVPLGDSMVVSSSSVVSVTVAVILLIGLLSVVLAVLFMRQRRLSRSFLSFANSHYSHASGITSINASDHNLEDEDSPVIQGFSDDEPLVLA